MKGTGWLAACLVLLACSAGSSKGGAEIRGSGDVPAEDIAGDLVMGPDGATDQQTADSSEGTDSGTDLGTDSGTTDAGAVDAAEVLALDLVAGAFDGNIVLGAPTATAVSAAVFSASLNGKVHFVYGTKPGEYAGESPALPLTAGVPTQGNMEALAADTRYYYRLYYEAQDGEGSGYTDEHTFHTARSSGSTFSFGIQGDSHPERIGKMFSPDLYALNMKNAAEKELDFYLAMGDDFSIEKLIEKDQLTEANVNLVYQNQQDFFGLVGHSAPVFLVNGNHEQAAGYLLSEAYPTPYADAPVLAGKARVTWFALPGPGEFYSVDPMEVAGVGRVRDYYAWEWGDALFVVIDPYWHSPVPVDTGVPGVEKEKDEWKKTIGDEQYQWLKTTLEGSKAKYKFVFEHHALGCGRGAAGMAHTYEWGGYDEKGKNFEFPTRRPAWDLPVHQLMQANHVTIFFFGHDHLFAREKVDGIVYQSLPNPADNTYTAFNADAYDPDSIPFPGAVYEPDYGVVLPNSGFVQVTVAPAGVTVSYVRAVVPGDEALAGCANGDVPITYSVTASNL